MLTSKLQKNIECSKVILELREDTEWSLDLEDSDYQKSSICGWHCDQLEKFLEDLLHFVKLHRSSYLS